MSLSSTWCAKTKRPNNVACRGYHAQALRPRRGHTDTTKTYVQRGKKGKINSLSLSLQYKKQERVRRAGTCQYMTVDGA